jgi:hypothetical protein
VSAPAPRPAPAPTAKRDESAAAPPPARRRQTLPGVATPADEEREVAGEPQGTAQREVPTPEQVAPPSAEPAPASASVQARMSVPSGAPSLMPAPEKEPVRPVYKTPPRMWLWIVLALVLGLLAALAWWFLS